MNTNEVRDQLIAAAPEHAGMIFTRDAVVAAWCAERGKSKDDLGIADILAIRSLPEWQAAS